MQYTLLSLLTAAAIAPCAVFAAAEVPAELESTEFSGSDITPCPACLCAAPTGEVFVGVDLLGSLGKGPGKGRIVRLIDKDNDGKADSHTVFAEVDNPRGLISVGTKLWVLHTVIPASTGKLTGMHVSLFEDKDWDGVADGPGKVLISDISPPKHNQDRGADHTTNGIRMGIDGWIYIAVGDFGIHGAKGIDGTELTMLGGGVVRFRPDGSEMEVYTHGLRNIYDIAIDPLMNIYTRGNTNDGGGWNVRFIHHVQSGEYGYPVLFKNFTDEIIPALVDVGGGSGTGSMFLQEEGWPEKYNNIPIMCDWGRSQLIIHRLTPDGPSFTQVPENFIKLSQITDVDTDASGRLYAGAWDGAGYKGNPNKGWVERIVPKGWTYKPFATPAKLDDKALIALLHSGSASARIAASQELLGRPAAANAVAAVAVDKSASLDSRVAAIFTYKQMAGTKAAPGLVKLTTDPAVREWALRALTDRKTQLAGVTKDVFTAGLKDADPRVQVAAAVSLGRLGDKSAAGDLLPFATMPIDVAAAALNKGLGTDRKEKPTNPEGPHATPNSGVVLPHVAVQALREIGAVNACVEAIGGPSTPGALWALRAMHQPAAVNGLIAKYGSAATKPERKMAILNTLIRLHHKEAPYDGSWWWSTRPDTRGPYYKPIPWGASQKIAAFVGQQYLALDAGGKKLVEGMNSLTRAKIPGIGKGEVVTLPKETGPKVDLSAIARAKGQVGKMSIEDVMLALDDVKGKPKLGEKLFTQQGCIACHTTDSSQPAKGPFMGQVGAILTREQIAESILKPNASVSQGFATISLATKDGKSMVGFISAQTADEIEMRDIAGGVHKFKTANIKSKTELAISMMPPGLANALSMEDFASLVAYLSSKKG